MKGAFSGQVVKGVGLAEEGIHSLHRYSTIPAAAASVNIANTATKIHNGTAKKPIRSPSGFWKDIDNIRAQLERIAPELDVHEVKFMLIEQVLLRMINTSCWIGTKCRADE
jgi:hypothetical protein